ncbi:unnamed protein product [Peniophora sp. CBMAI 1063]|nr:unnamed protein product [Peniophora sp. CBMAI 1063]
MLSSPSSSGLVCGPSIAVSYARLDAKRFAAEVGRSPIKPRATRTQSALTPNHNVPHTQSDGGLATSSPLPFLGPARPGPDAQLEGSEPRGTHGSAVCMRHRSLAQLTDTYTVFLPSSQLARMCPERTRLWSITPAAHNRPFHLLIYSVLSRVYSQLACLSVVTIVYHSRIATPSHSSSLYLPVLFSHPIPLSCLLAIVLAIDSP